MGRMMIAVVCNIALLVGVGNVQAERWRHTDEHRKDSLTSTIGKHHSGELSFETVRMLSTGMSKADVLMKVGPPRYRFTGKGTQRWIYAAPDHWVVEVVFTGNNAVAINSTRP